MWAIYSCIAELPPILRNSYENIISHLSWSGSNPDFNYYLENYNNQIDDLLKNGVEFKNVKINFRINLFLADAPALAKACFCNQYNGKYI